MPCNVDHEHNLVDMTYQTRAEAESYVDELRKIYYYRRRDSTRMDRTYWACKKTMPETKTLCKAHIHLVAMADVGGTISYRLKGCIAHCHEPVKRRILCSEKHEHQIIEQNFESIDECR